MSAARRAVMRADASPTIGGGHVMRCLALAEALADEGWAVTFAGTPQTRETVAALGRSGHGWLALARPDDADELIAALPGGCDLLVVDHYGLDRRYETACRAVAQHVLVIDDLADRDHDCDALLDPTYGRRSADYAARVPAECRIVTGPAYAPLRSDFARARDAMRRDYARVHRVLVSMGTVDAGGVLPAAMEALAGASVAIDVAVGSSAPHLARIQEAARAVDARLHLDAPDMPRLMAAADLAVLAAGSTTWEAAALSLPMILIVTADNQRGVARAMAEVGAAAVAQNADDILKCVRMLTADTAQRARMGAAAGAICDGRGARRLAILARPECDAGGRPVTLRAATFDDSARLLAWQQHPRTRKFARNPAAPHLAEHEAWLAGKLSDAGCLFNIVMCGDEPAGMLRLDRIADEPHGYEISILTAPELYRGGIALAGVHLAGRLVPEARLHAEVLAGNAASRQLFEKAGFLSAGGGRFVRGARPMPAATRHSA